MKFHNTSVDFIGSSWPRVFLRLFIKKFSRELTRITVSSAVSVSRQRKIDWSMKGILDKISTGQTRVYLNSWHVDVRAIDEKYTQAAASSTIFPRGTRRTAKNGQRIAK